MKTLLLWCYSGVILVLFWSYSAVVLLAVVLLLLFF